MVKKSSYSVSIVGDLGKKTVLECSEHGSQSFNKESDDRYRCSRCNADRVLRRKKKLKAELVEAAGGECIQCGYNKSINALQFHHRDPSQKSFGLGSMTSFNKKLVKEEAAKCDLLCANCHAEIEEKIRLDP